MAFLFDSIKQFWNSLLRSLGFEGKKGSLLLLGLDNAGKTTLLHRLRTGDIRSFPPTDRPYQDSFNYQGISFQAWDLGGHEAVRHLWEDYMSTDMVSAVLFLLDAADSERTEEAAYELDALILGEDRLLQDVPVAILCNKCDMESTLSTDEICRRIEYTDLAKAQGADNIAIFRISVLQGEGYQEAFRWISKFL